MIRIGTRGSPLALVQAEELKLHLMQAHALPADQFQIIPIQTTGDNITDQKLIEFGGKGLFTKEIELALFDRTIDVAVHSMKDVATTIPKGLMFACMLPREDPRDVWICRTGHSLATLPAGSRVGTSALRRSAQVLHQRPDLQVVTLRGSVETRLNKLELGEADATLLALAGLKRLKKEHVANEVLGTEEFLPAVAQGALGVQCREDDDGIIELLRPLDDKRTTQCVNAERAFLRGVDGSCRAPVAALAAIDKAKFSLKGMVAEPDGRNLIYGTTTGNIADAEEKSFELGAKLKERLHK